MAFGKIKEFISPKDEDFDDEDYDTDETEITYRPTETKPVSTYEAKKTTMNEIPSNTQMVLFEPRSFEEAEEIARHLKQKRACVVNLHKLQRDYAQRTIDFLTGVVFALDGTIQKIGHNVILCTPQNIPVSGGITMETEDE